MRTTKTFLFFTLVSFLFFLVSCTVEKQQNDDIETKDTLQQREPNQIVDSTGDTDTIQQGVDELIGIWQNSPEIASGYTDHYEFFENGDFVFNYNEMICDKRTINYSGTWELLDGNNLKLTVKKQKIVVGGKMVPTGDAGSCASDYYIEGGEVKTENLSDSTYQRIILSSITIDTRKRDLKTRKFDQQQFWKIKDPLLQEDDD